MNTVNVRNIIIGEGIPKICVPIVGKTKEELLSEVEVLNSVPVDVVEWRMDWFEEVECCEKAVAMLQVLREAMPEMPILATFRSKKMCIRDSYSTAGSASGSLCCKTQRADGNTGFRLRFCMPGYACIFSGYGGAEADLCGRGCGAVQYR